MSKINKSWEKERDEIHSPNGVKELRKAVKFGLSKKYKGIAESMWEYKMEDERLEDMRVMSWDTVPELFLMKNGQCVWFEDPATEQVHCLPFVNALGINMYGKPNDWYPIPVGWSDRPGANNPESMERIRNMRLDSTNSVIMRNDRFGGNDEQYIDKMIDELVDNTLTLNQLQLLAKCPFVFNVTEDNMLTAKNFFLAICEDKPVIYTNANGDKIVATVEKLDVKIDPALFEIFDRFECQILEYIGLPCVPITKRAQQSVSEVDSNEDKIYLRRMEKFNQRRFAVERIKKMFGVNIEVSSVIDDVIKERNEQEMKVQQNKGANNDVQ